MDSESELNNLTAKQISFILHCDRFFKEHKEDHNICTSPVTFGQQSCHSESEDIFVDLHQLKTNQPELLSLIMSSENPSRVASMTGLPSQRLSTDESIEALEAKIQELKDSLQAKPSVEKLIESDRQSEIFQANQDDDIETFKSELNKVNNLISKLKARSGKLEDIEAIISAIEEVAVSFPEAYEAIEFYHACKKTQIMLEFYATICSTERYQNSTEEPGIDVREVEHMLGEAEKLGIEFGKEQEIIKKKLKQVKEFELDIKDLSIDSCVEMECLESLAQEAQGLGIDFPKAKEIRNKHHLLSHSNSKPEKKSQPMIYYSLHPDLIPFTQTPTLRSTNSRPQDIFMEEFDGSLELSAEWLNSLTCFYQRHYNKEADLNDDDTEKLQQVSSYSTRASVDELQQLRMDFMDNQDMKQIIQDHFLEFRSLIFQGVSISEHNQHILDILVEHAKQYWILEIGRLDTGIFDLSENDLSMLKRLANLLDQNENQSEYTEFFGTFSKYYKWMYKYSDLVSSKTAINIMKGMKIKAEDLKNLRTTISSLLKQTPELEIDTEKEQQILNKILGYLNWILNALTCIEEIEKGQKVNFEEMTYLCAEAEFLRIPNDNVVYKKLYYLTEVQSSLNNFESFKRKVANTTEKFAEISNDNCLNKIEFQKELLEISKQKPLISDAIKLRQALEQKSFIQINSAEWDEFNRSVDACVVWKEKVEKFLVKYQLEDNEALKEYQADEIATELNTIANEMIWLVIKDEEKEKQVRKFEWMFHAKLLLTGEEKFKVKEVSQDPIVFWRKLLKLANKMPELDLDSTHLYRTVKNQIDIYNELIAQIIILKEHGSLLERTHKDQDVNIKLMRRGLIGEDELNKLAKKFIICQIDAGEKSQYLDGLLQEICRLKISFKVLQHKFQKEINFSSESGLSEARVLLDQAYKLPVKLDMEGFLENYVKSEQGLVNKTDRKSLQNKFQIRKEDIEEAYLIVRSSSSDTQASKIRSDPKLKSIKHINKTKMSIDEKRKHKFGYIYEKIVSNRNKKQERFFNDKGEDFNKVHKKVKIQEIKEEGLSSYIGKNGLSGYNSSTFVQ